MCILVANHGQTVRSSSIDKYIRIRIYIRTSDPGDRFTKKRTIKFTIVLHAHMRAFHQTIRKRTTYEFSYFMDRIP